MNTKEAIDLAKAGSEKAFTALYNVHYKMVYNNVYNIVRNKDVADDLTSETFLKAFKNIGQFKKDISFEMWLKTIANNHSIDWIRSGNKSKHDIYIDDDRLAEFICSDFSNPEKDLIKKDEKELLELALKSMAERPKRILTMRYVDDMTYKEIAEKLNLNIGTIKHYLHQYKAKIINQINNQKQPKNENTKSIMVNGNEILS